MIDSFSHSLVDWLVGWFTVSVDRSIDFDLSVDQSVEGLMSIVD